LGQQKNFKPGRRLCFFGGIKYINHGGGNANLEFDVIIELIWSFFMHYGFLIPTILVAWPLEVS